MINTAYCAYISPISSCSLVKKRFCLFFVFCFFLGGWVGGGGLCVCEKRGGREVVVVFCF